MMRSIVAILVLVASCQLGSVAQAQDACPTRAGLFFRYVSAGEANKIADIRAVPNTNQLGHLKPLYITDCFYASRQHAQARLALPQEPAFRVQFQLPLASCTAIVRPEFGQPGGGHECTLDERIPVENPKAQIVPLE